MVVPAADVPRCASGGGSIRIARRGCNRGASGASGRRILRRVSSASTDLRQADGRLVLAFVCATAYAVVLNGTMLPVALPEIGEALSQGPVYRDCIIPGYFLVNGVAIPFFGRLADLHGVGRLYTIGLATFFFGSFLCVAASVSTRS